MSQYILLVRSSPGFARLWSAQVISLAGDWFNTVVLLTLVAEYSGDSGLAISAFLLARFLPMLVIGPFAGVVVDRFDRRRILIYSNAARAGLVLLYLLATTPGTLWLIYALSVIQFTFSAFFEPGQGAILPSLVRREDLVTANTLSSITWSAMLAIGAALGGAVAALVGPAAALIFDAVTFAAAAYLIASIRPEHTVSQAGDEPAAPTTGESGSLRDGLRYLAANRATAAVLLVKGGTSLGNVDLLMTVYATQLFVLGDGGNLSLGIMFSAFGVGAILGPLLLNRVNDGSVTRMRRLVILGYVWAVLGWFVFGAAGSLAVASAALLIRAMGGSVNWTYSSVIIQKIVPDRYLGRVFALDYAVFQLATVLSTLTHGGLVEWLGSGQVRAIVYGTGALSLVPLMLWALAVLRMEEREAARARTQVASITKS